MFFRKRGVLLSCVSTCIMLVLVFSPLAIGSSGKTLQATPIVLFEELTSSYYPYAPAFTPVMNKFWDDYGSSKLAKVGVYYNLQVGPDLKNDSLTIWGAKSKQDYYKVNSIPTVIIDGIKMYRIGFDVDQFNISTAIPAAINTRLAVERDFTLSVSGEISDGQLSVHIEKIGSPSVSGLMLRSYVVECDLYNPNGTNPDKFYQHVARYITSTQAIDPASLPKDTTVSVTFNPMWNTQRLAFITFLQSDATKEVLQATYYGYSSVPEINPIIIIPIGGLFIAVFALASIKSRGKSEDEYIN